MENKALTIIGAKRDALLFSMALALALALFFVLLLLAWLAFHGDVL